MKQIKTFNKLAVFFFLILFGCEKNDILPDITEEGLNTFGMLVDGKIWKPYTPISIVGPISLDIKYSTHSHLLNIEALNTKKGQGLSFYAEKIQSVGYYNFSYRNNFKASDTSCHSCIYYKDSTRFEDESGIYNAYKLTDSVNSVINITRLDTFRSIISGTFSLNLKNPSGKIINITEGRFDFHYLSIE